MAIKIYIFLAIILHTIETYFQRQWGEVLNVNMHNLLRTFQYRFDILLIVTMSW